MRAVKNTGEQSLKLQLSWERGRLGRYNQWYSIVPLNDIMSHSGLQYFLYLGLEEYILD